jgi:hypothetical protein
MGDLFPNLATVGEIELVFVNGFAAELRADSFELRAGNPYEFTIHD